jgi:hypothetical protein
MRIVSSIVLATLSVSLMGQTSPADKNSKPRQSAEQESKQPSSTPAAPEAAQEPGASNPDERQVPPAASTEQDDPRYGLLTPIPEKGGISPIYSKLYGVTADQIRHRAQVRDYTKQVRQIRQKHFGSLKSEKLRAEGLTQLKEFSDPAAFMSLITELAQEKDDVRLALLDHFKAQGDEGQAALAHVVIYDKDTAIRNEALRRLKSPAAQPVLYMVDRALRSKDADAANAAAVIVNTLDIVRAIPLLIFAQASVTGPAEPAGDLAWIAFQTQRAYVAGLVPVVGNNAGGFQPIIGVVSEGAILRVVDAVVIEYRTVVHGSLVNLTTRDWGKPTDPMGYNVQAWWDWYNKEYLPFKNQREDDSRAGG